MNVQASPTTSPFGKRVIGEEAYQRQKEVREKGWDIYGPRVLDDHPRNRKDAAPTTPDVTGGDVLRSAADTVSGLEAWLMVHPEHLDEAILLEFERARPRKGALDVFVQIENRRTGGPREDVLSSLKTRMNTD